MTVKEVKKLLENVDDNRVVCLVNNVINNERDKAFIEINMVEKVTDDYIDIIDGKLKNGNLLIIY